MLVGWIAKSANTQIASVRYRCLVPIESLVARGFPVEQYRDSNAANYSLVIFSKVYGVREQQMVRDLKQRGIKTALDLCDNHFYNPNNIPSYIEAAKNLREMLGLVDACICSTASLRDEILKNVDGCPPVFIVGDAIEQLPPSKRWSWFSLWRRNLPILLWQGIHGVPNAECGMLDVLRVKEILSTLSQEYRFELIVLSNNHEKYKTHIRPLPFPTRYIPWTLPRLRGLLDEASAVLIPVTPNPFTLCKTNNRLVLPLSYGVPVIADTIPSYSEFAPYTFLDCWEEGLRAVLERRPYVLERTEQGQRAAKESYSSARVAIDWENALRAIQEGVVVESVS